MQWRVRNLKTYSLINNNIYRAIFAILSFAFASESVRTKRTEEHRKFQFWTVSSMDYDELPTSYDDGLQGISSSVRSVPLSFKFIICRVVIMHATAVGADRINLEMIELKKKT